MSDRARQAQIDIVQAVQCIWTGVYLRSCKCNVPCLTFVNMRRSECLPSPKQHQRASLAICHTTHGSFPSKLVFFERLTDVERSHHLCWQHNATVLSGIQLQVQGPSRPADSLDNMVNNVWRIWVYARLIPIATCHLGQTMT